MEELRANLDLYLELKEGESKEQALERLHDILNNVQKENAGFVVSDIYDSEIQEV